LLQSGQVLGIMS